MTTVHPESPGDFEFIVTPAAPEQTKPAFDCGVKTTLVSNYRNSTYISEAALASTFLRMNLIFFFPLASTPLSKMLLSPPTRQAAIVSQMA